MECRRMVVRQASSWQITRILAFFTPLLLAPTFRPLAAPTGADGVASSLSLSMSSAITRFR